MPGLSHLEAARVGLAGIGHRTPALQGLVRFASAREDYQDQVQHVLAPNDQSLGPGKTSDLGAIALLSSTARSQFQSLAESG